MTWGESEPASPPTCIACGSAKVIPDVRILDQGKHSDGDLKVVVFANPEALIFKERVYGKLLAQICGECGYTWLRVSKPEALYEAYCHALANQEPKPKEPAPDWPPNPGLE